MPENARSNTREPLPSYRSMFDAEVQQAIAELKRPNQALFASGVIAGASVGFSVLLLGLIVASYGEMPDALMPRLLLGSAYAAGFVLAILARADLFTEYTTIAILPILTGGARMADLARLWSLVYLGNFVGGVWIALAAVFLGPEIGIFESGDLGVLAHHLSRYSWWVILLSAVLAGWLMGLLSWLIAGGRDTTSQILFIGLIGIAIGALGLHHSITGSIEMLAGLMADPAISWGAVLYVVSWTTLGNAIGGILFAFVIRQGVQMHGGDVSRADREEGRKRQRSRRS